MAISEFVAITATAASLAIDAFSVSICIGLCHENLKLREALVPSAAFGLFQFIMPLTGGAAAVHLLKGFVGGWTPWVAAALISYVALNMIREAYLGGENKSSMSLNLKNVIVLAVATSLDALAVGFSIESTGGSALLLAILAAVITFGLSLFGALVGKKLGSRLGQRAEYIGGGVLLIIALKIILDTL